MTKVLIIRFSSIGDIVLTTPVIRCLKQQVNNAEIHYLTKKSFSDLLMENPYVHKVHVYDADFASLMKKLKKENFDYIIDLHHNLRSTLVKISLRKPSFSFNKLNLRKWLLVNCKINTLPALHIVDRYMETVKHIGVVNDYKGLDYFIPEKDNVEISTLPVTHQQGYIGFVIGAKHFTKRLPVEKVISICKQLHKPIVLLGGKEDAEAGEIIRKNIGEQIYNACGKYNLNQSASLVKQAIRIISHDTGLMHIAAAFKKDIISVWGSTVTEFGMYPYLAGEKSKIAEVKGLPCRPCSKIGYSQCPKKHFNCMQQMDESVFTA